MRSFEQKVLRAHVNHFIETDQHLDGSIQPGMPSSIIKRYVPPNLPQSTAHFLKKAPLQ
jgi:hypothetical protein